MSGTAIAGGGADEGRGPGLVNGASLSDINSFRIDQVIDRLSRQSLEPRNFVHMCLSLARGIDFAILNQEVSRRAQELPKLLKQVCQKKNDPLMQPAIMILMVSAKNACQSGWFSDKDSEELRNLLKEISSNFCSVPNLNTDPSCSHSVISTIMSRFYPRMEMGHMFVFLEAKPGFDAYVSDFQISKNLKSAPGGKVRLFVVQTDSIETSSCLISPPKVNFLVNGKAVSRRTNISLDTGPQIPTNVTQYLKFGTNLLQAVGEFEGNYIIAVAIMNDVPNLDSNALQDYKQHAPAIVDSDSEVIEGSSRISLNCPISLERINIPVKGRSCNHIQCFDFANYVDINSRRPSWRCPHCNQYVCFIDIRIDQKIVKILNEVGPKVTDIVLSSDGTWNTAMEIDNTTKRSGDPKPENVSLPDTTILDLTQTDDFMDYVSTHEPQDRKPNPIAAQNQSTTSFVSTELHGVRTNKAINQVHALPVQTPNSVQERSRIVSFHNSHSTVPQTSPAIGSNPRPVPPMPSPPLHQYSPRFPNVGFPTQNQATPHAYRMPQSMSQPSSATTMDQPHTSFPRPQIKVGAPQNRGVLNSQQNFLASANRDAHMPVDSSRNNQSIYQRTPPVRDQMDNNGFSSQPLPRTDSNDSTNMNWRPEGRMRGALSGRAYVDALNQYIIQSQQPSQPTRQISDVTSLPANAQVQSSMPERVAQGSTLNHTSPGPVSRPDGMQ